MSAADNLHQSYSVPEAAAWAEILESGSEDQKIPVRWLLATVLERQGDIDKAADLHEINMKLGIFMPSNVEILARLYRKQERLLLADQLEWDYNAISNPD